jgi:hypothetical protein
MTLFVLVNRMPNALVELKLLTISPLIVLPFDPAPSVRPSTLPADVPLI